MGPQKSHESVSVRLPVGVWKRVRLRSVEEGVPASVLVGLAIERWLASLEPAPFADGINSDKHGRSFSHGPQSPKDLKYEPEGGQS